MQIPNLPRTQKTLLEIMRVHNKEVPMANLLGFLFNPENEHHLGSLFIEALLETTCYELNKTKAENGQLYKNGYKLNPETFKVHPETESQYWLPNSFGSKVKLEKGESRKRMDLFITNETEKFTIVIEFKINHSLNNPLETYRRSVEKKDYADHQLFFVVLTPTKKDAGFNSSEITQFKQVVLSDFIETIKSKLPYSDFVQLNRDNIYFQYFLQFINTIENRKKNKEIRELILKHKLSPDLLKEETVLNRDWRNELNKVDTEIDLRLKRLKRKLKLDASSLHRGRNADKSVIPFNRYLKVNTAAFDFKIRLTLKSWTIEKWKKESGHGYKILEEYAYTTSTDFMVQEAKRFMEEISFLTASYN